MRGSREISLVPSLHRASTDALILGESSIIPLDILGKGTQVGSKRYWERVPLFH